MADTAKTRRVLQRGTWSIRGRHRAIASDRESRMRTNTLAERARACGGSPPIRS